MTNGIADTMQALYRRFGELAGIQIELHKSLLAIRVENAAATATVFLQGAQISHYQKRGEPPILWCSPLCDYSEHLPLRGGIPLCWPWFGALEKNPEAVKHQISGTIGGAHGFVRNLPWKLADIAVLNERQTELTFTLRLYNGQEPAWPWATELTLTAIVGDSLSVSFAVENQSNENLSYSSALHSYFSVSDIASVSVDGLNDLDYTDCIEGWSIRRQQDMVVIDREVDRIYHGANRPIILIDKGWQRSVTVTSSGSNSAVLWNPWQEKSRRLSQFDDSAYKEMLCIETANAADDFVTLGPSQRYQLAVTIDSHPLN